MSLNVYCLLGLVYKETKKNLPKKLICRFCFPLEVVLLSILAEYYPSIK